MEKGQLLIVRKERLSQPYHLPIVVRYVGNYEVGDFPNNQRVHFVEDYTGQALVQSEYSTLEELLRDYIPIETWTKEEMVKYELQLFCSRIVVCSCLSR